MPPLFTNNKQPMAQNPLLAAVPSPIFELGKVPSLPHCELQQREYRKDGKWYYAIRNNYNPWGSGWADEDFIIGQITKEKERVARHGG